MKVFFSRLFLGETQEISNINQLQERLLNISLLSTAIMGTVFYLLSLIPTFENGTMGVFMVKVILFAWLLIILIVRQLPYVFRAGSWVTILFSVGLIHLIQNGPNINSWLMLLAFVGMTILLLGSRFGLAALLMSSASMTVFAIIKVIGMLPEEQKLLQISPVQGILEGLAFMAMGLLITVLLAGLVGHLKDGMQMTTLLAETLKGSNAPRLTSEQRFRAMVEDSTDIIAILSNDGTIQYINPSAEEILGYKREELIGRKIFEFLHPEDVNFVVAAMTPGITAEEIGPSLELRVRQKDGAWRTLEARGNEMHTDPAVNGTIINCRDITERKAIEKALQESHRLREMLFAGLNDAVFILDAKTTRIIDCNLAASRIFGYSREELLGQTTAFLHTDLNALEDYRKHLYPAIESEGILSHFEFRMKRKDGTIFPTEHSVVPLENPQDGRIGWVSLVQDITERKNLEKKLQEINESLEFQVTEKTRQVQEREQIQHAILEATDQTIIMIDLNGIILMTNQVGAKRLNKEPKDFLGVCVYDLFPPELARSRKAVIDKIVQTGKPISFQDERDGIIFDNNLYPIFYRDGHIHYIVLYARDITLQKNTELALQASEEKYRALAEVSQDLIFIVDANDKIQYVNTNAARQLGREPEQLIGENQSEFFPPDIAALQLRSIHETIQSGKPKYEERWSKFGPGPDTYVSTWLVPLNIPSLGAPAALGVSRDITAIKNAEEELKNSHVQLEQRVAERTWELNELSAGMRRLARKLITAQEEERRRISRELHDDTGQVLVTLKYSLDEFLNELPTGHEKLPERILESIRAVDEVTASIRTIAHSLRPPLLDAGGLNISLKDFCQDLASRTKIKVHYSGVELNDVPDDIAVTLYRFVQEAFSNVLKHSHATSVSVKMQFNKQQIIVSVFDNGVGTQDPQDTTGIGLVGLRERVGFLGGELLIDASPGKGTRIKASIPWNPDNS